MEQLSNLARIASEAKGAVMLLGDLNSTSWGSYFHRLIQDGKLTDSRRGYGLQLSFPARKLIFGQLLYLTPIDHILVSSEISILDRYLGPYVGSDHYPVIIDFSMKSNPK
jgi:endonuclease/exonuclease/phosphatase (EEP) superfamily protein YafD